MKSDELTEEQRQALDDAESALENSYNPYSRFAVGACLVMANGCRITGANVENAAYGSTICAERSAIVRGERPRIARMPRHRNHRPWQEENGKAWAAHRARATGYRALWQLSANAL
jgi:hypothetical protein